MLSSLRRLRALLVAGALAVPVVAVLPAAPSVAAPNVCTNDHGYFWQTEQDMEDAEGAHCRSTFVDDPGLHNLLDRRQLLAAADLYGRQGFDRQWLWYAPETVRHINAGSSQLWTDCPADLHVGGPCPNGVDLNRSFISADDFGGRAVDLHVFQYDSRFIGRACGNFGVPFGDTSNPVPVIAGRKYDDRNRNGRPDDGEPGVGDVSFQLIRDSSLFGDQAAGVVTETTSADDGSFAFRLDGIGPGRYTVHEISQSGWVSTTGLDQTLDVPDGIGNATVATVQFGNRAQHPPVPDAGPAQYVDQTASDGTPVVLDGSASSDPDGDPLSYTWTGTFGTAYGVSPTVTLPVGTWPIQLSVSDGIDTKTALTSVTVYPPITGSVMSVAAVEGASFTGPLAVFDDSDPNATADEYAANVDWGDGTASSPAVITKGDDGRFLVAGTHTYAEEGTSKVTVSVVDIDNAFNAMTEHATATVADAPLHAGNAMAVTGVEGNPLEATVASFTDDNPGGSVADFTASVDWGDGSEPTSGTVSESASGGFAVAASHVYADEGDYSTTVTVLDDGGSRVVVGGSAHVADAPLAASGVDDLSTNPVDETLATFTDGNPGATTADFTATVDWGDGSTPTSGAVTGPAGGPFTVRAAHTYATLGPKTITVLIVDDGGSTATAVSHVLLYAFPARGDFVIGDGSARVDGQVTFWGAQWSKANVVSGGVAPDAFKGYESTVSGDGGSALWTTTPGDSSAPPTDVPTYLAVIVTSSVQQSGSAITGDESRIAIVRTDAGYAPAPGHVGTGTVVAFLR